MKKKFGLLLMLLAATFMTGCVKYNVNMDIKSDKSMNFDIIYAVDTSIFGDQSTDSGDYKKLTDAGFKVEDYTSDKYKGVKISKSIKNIDKSSTVEENKYSLSKMAEEDQPYLFTVKKGIFKNTYVANFIFDASDSDMSSEDKEETKETESTDSEGLFDDLLSDADKLIDDLSSDITLGDTNDDITTDGEDESDDFSKALEGMTSSMGNMDLSFNVTLPYKALDSNATKVENDGKNLSWSLTSEKSNTISFEFELYNIYNIIGIAAAGVIFVVIVILSCTKKKKNTKPVAPAAPVNTTPAAPVDTTPVNTPNSEFNMVNNQTDNNINNTNNFNN